MPFKSRRHDRTTVDILHENKHTTLHQRPSKYMWVYVCVCIMEQTLHNSVFNIS